MNDQGNVRQNVLITGASRGIGLELAREFASHNFNLILVARNKEQLAAVAAELQQQFYITVQVIPLDLSLPGAPAQLFETVRTLEVAVDILINNAGIVSFGKFAETDLEHELQLMQLNMVSLTHLAKIFLKPMLERGHGRIVNVASLGGYQPGGPLWAVYFATKAYILSFSKALSVELRGTGVSITVLCPGATDTGFKDAGLGETLLYRYLSMDAKEVARTGYSGIMQGKTVIIPGLLNKLLAFAGELPPRRIALEVNALLMRK